jgi:hypothetical protein
MVFAPTVSPGAPLWRHEPRHIPWCLRCKSLGSDLTGDNLQRHEFATS